MAEKNTQDIAAMKAELMAELRAELAREAEEKNAARSAEEQRERDWLDELVPVQLFKDGRDYRDDVFVSVNGENCVIRRGYPVLVKRKFALVLDQSQQQDAAAAAFAESLQREYTQQAKLYNL